MPAGLAIDRTSLPPPESLRREFRTTNDWEAIKGLVNQRRSGFNYDQTYKVLHSVGGDPVKVRRLEARRPLRVA